MSDTWWWWNQVPYLFTLAVPIAWVMAWAWTAPRSPRLRVEAAKAAVVGIPLGAILTCIALGALFPGDPDDSVQEWVRSLEELLVVPLPLAVWASVTFGVVLAALGGRQGRPLAPARSPATRPLVLGVAVAGFLSLVLVAYLSKPVHPGSIWCP